MTEAVATGDLVLVIPVGEAGMEADTVGVLKGDVRPTDHRLDDMARLPLPLLLLLRDAADN